MIKKRHEEILEILKEEGFVAVRDLGERLYASQPTIRRDLDFLEKEGLIRRNHGGAMLVGETVNTQISYRRGRKAHEKMRIAKLAATLIENGQLIFIDGSTTALCLSDFITKSDKVTVVTNGIPICQALAKQELRVFSTGGRLVGESMAFAGNIAEKTISGYNADIMFFSMASLDNNGMISDFAEEERSLRLAMHARSRRSVFLCDSEKFGRSSSFCLFELKEVDYVVTDAPLSEELAKMQGFELIKESDGAYMYGKVSLK